MSVHIGLDCPHCEHGLISLWDEGAELLHCRSCGTEYDPHTLDEL